MVEWIGLGKPSSILTNFTSEGYAIQRFLWKREFERLGDQVLSRKCRAFLYFLSTFLVVFLVLALVLSRSGAA